MTAGVSCGVAAVGVGVIISVAGMAVAGSSMCVIMCHSRLATIQFYPLGPQGLRSASQIQRLIGAKRDFILRAKSILGYDHQ